MGTGGEANSHQLKDKNILPCRIILLDGTDLSVDLSVGVPIVVVIKCSEY